MSSPGYETWTITDVEKRNAKIAHRESPAQSSKYHNVKVTVDGEQFDSKREASYWLLLKARQRAGEIRDLRRQVPVGLFCQASRPTTPASWGIQVSSYIADFEYFTDNPQTRHLVDAKGHRTALYKLKAKWVTLQLGITIEEV